MKSRIILPVMVVGIIAVAALGSTSLASAQESDSESPRQSLISRISTRFGLNETEVEETFKEFRMDLRAERNIKMDQHLEYRLDKAVEDGKLTEDQMFAMMEKHEDIEGRFDDLYDLSDEDRREAIADIHEEMQAWAEENDIDLNQMGRFRRRFVHGMSGFSHGMSGFSHGMSGFGHDRRFMENDN